MKGGKYINTTLTFWEYLTVPIRRTREEYSWLILAEYRNGLARFLLETADGILTEQERDLRPIVSFLLDQLKVRKPYHFAHQFPLREARSWFTRSFGTHSYFVSCTTLPRLFAVCLVWRVMHALSTTRIDRSSYRLYAALDELRAIVGKETVDTLLQNFYEGYVPNRCAEVLKLAQQDEHRRLWYHDLLFKLYRHVNREED